MSEVGQIPSMQVLLIGLAVVISALLQGLARRLALPALVFYLLFGFVLRLADSQWGFMSEPIREAFSLLANLGIVALLFDVGLTSDPSALARRLPAASIIWIGNMLVAFAIGFIIAAFAGWLGFSLAIGALFAGLVFSHDRVALRTERSFRDLYGFLTPFFFINIGFHVDPTSLGEASQIGGALLLAAAIGKLLGDGIPAWWIAGGTGAAAITVSMLPRAEITMIVMHHGRELGEDVISNHLYSGTVLVSALTCLVTPLMLKAVLKRWPQKEQTPE